MFVVEVIKASQLYTSVYASHENAKVITLFLLKKNRVERTKRKRMIKEEYF